MTGVRFRRYVDETRAPTLKQGDTVVLDNLPAHKVSGIRERIEAAGARLLYLPAYSLEPKDREATSIRVWMAPAGQGCRIGSGELVGCGHVYGV